MYHITNLGAFGGTSIPRDIDGYVPEAGDDPFAGNWDHGVEDTHDDDGQLTEYGRWWVEEGFPEIVAEAVEATRKANEEAAEWQRQNA